MFKFKNYDLKHYNFSLLFIVITLGSIGMYMIQQLQEADERQFEKQIIGYIFGISLALFISMIDYHFICKFFVVLYLINFMLLVACKFTPLGSHHWGAYRWITVLGIEVQPSELTKIILILFFAKFFDIYKKQINKVSTVLFAILLAAIPTVLIMIQTDLSTSIVVFISFLAILFVAGLSYKVIIPAILVGFPTVAGLLWYVQQPYQKLLIGDYQQIRILAWLQPEKYPQKAYQQTNAVKAITSGGISGKLLTEGSSSLKSGNVPVIESDFIFTSIAEAFGFIGSLFVLVLLAIFIIMAIRIAHRAIDYMGMLIATGIASLVMFQIFVNIGVVTFLLPNTGIPLPFVSSGLSALMGNMIMLGVLLNVSLQNKRMLPKDQTLTL